MSWEWHPRTKEEKLKYERIQKELIKYGYLPEKPQPPAPCGKEQPRSVLLLLLAIALIINGALLIVRIFSI